MQKDVLISAIVAMTENNVIGINNQLPWHLPADLAHFKSITSGHAILMGRKTHESIGRPLPGRLNIIMSRNSDYEAAGCSTANSLDAACTLAGKQGYEKLFVIGGAEIYRQLLPEVKTLFLTIVHANVEGDTVFPDFNEKEWRETERISHKADEKNQYDYSFVTFERV